MPETIEISLHPKQMAFRRSEAVLRGFVGGRGVGKSFVGTYDLIRRAKPKRLYGLYAPTYPMLRDATLRSFLGTAKRLRFLREFRKADSVAVLGNDAEVICRSLDDPEHARGPNLSGAYIDEASLIAREAFDIIIACLREDGEQGWLSATFTPKGKSHWTYPVFTNPNLAEIFTASSRENPFLPDSYVHILQSQYTTALAMQEIEGQFVELGTGLFQPQWFKIVDDFPHDCKKVRRWDLAATLPKKGKDPDWTAGCLLGLHNGQWWILDVQHFQDTPKGNEDRIGQTAHIDGFETAVRMEQEPGASGVGMIDHYARNVLVGFDFKGVPSSGDKYVRAQPVAAAAENGNVFMLRGPWNKAFLDEIEAFPSGPHDDQVDSLSGAANDLGLHAFNPRMWAGGLQETHDELVREQRLEAMFAELTPAEKVEAMRIMQAGG